jgi:shikimate kinase
LVVVRRVTISIQFLVLLGPPGSGKTTLGKLLARELGYSYRDIERELLHAFGSADAFLANKPAVLARIEAEIHARAADLDLPVVIESTGLSDRDMLMRLPPEETLIVGLFVPESVCAERIAQRQKGSNFNNDPETQTRFHRFWEAEIAPTYTIDLKLNTHAATDEELVSLVKETVARRAD